MISLSEHLILELSTDTYKKAVERARETGDVRADKFFTKYLSQLADEYAKNDELPSYIEDLSDYVKSDGKLINKIKTLKSKFECDFSDRCGVIEFNGIKNISGDGNTFDVHIGTMQLDADNNDTKYFSRDNCIDVPSLNGGGVEDDAIDFIIKYNKKVASAASIKYNKETPYLPVRITAHSNNKTYTLCVTYYPTEKIGVITSDTIPHEENVTLDLNVFEDILTPIIKSVDSSFKFTKLKTM